LLPLFHSEVELFTDTDAVFAGFCSGCIGAPSNCSLAHNYTISELQQIIYSFLESIKYNPIPLSIPSVRFLLDYSIVKSLVFSILYAPASWPRFATVLDGLLAGNLSVVGDYITALLAAPSGLDDEAEFGIKCGDTVALSSSLEDALPEILARHQKSRIAGDTVDSVEMLCAQWDMAATERYGGNFQVRMRNPLLVIGNTFNPVTPLVSDRNVSSGFEGSVLLQHNGYGVCSH
jgi:hypothetical protein